MSELEETERGARRINHECGTFHSATSDREQLKRDMLGLCMIE